MVKKKMAKIKKKTEATEDNSFRDVIPQQ